MSALQEELGFDASEAELDDAFVCTLPTQVVRFVDRNVSHHNAGIAQFCCSAHFVAVHTLSQCILCRNAHLVAVFRIVRKGAAKYRNGPFLCTTLPHSHTTTLLHCDTTKLLNYHFFCPQGTGETRNGPFVDREFQVSSSLYSSNVVV